MGLKKHLSFLTKSLSSRHLIGSTFFILTVLSHIGLQAATISHADDKRFSLAAKTRTTDNIGSGIIFGAEDFPPYSYKDKDTGELRGLAIDIVKEMLVLTEDSNSIIKMYPFARLYKMALDKENVAVISMVHSKQRDPLFKWVGIIHFPQSYLWKLKSRSDIVINTADDLSKYKIVVSNNGIDEQIFTSLYGFKRDRELYPVVDNDSRFKMITNLRGDLFEANLYGLQWDMTEQGYDFNTMERVYQVPEMGSDLSLAFSDETDDVIVEKYRDALYRLKLTGAHNRIVTKWTKKMARLY